MTTTVRLRTFTIGYGRLAYDPDDRIGPHVIASLSADTTPTIPNLTWDDGNNMTWDTGDNVTWDS